MAELCHGESETTTPVSGLLHDIPPGTPCERRPVHRDRATTPFTPCENSERQRAGAAANMGHAATYAAGLRKIHGGPKEGIQGRGNEQPRPSLRTVYHTNNPFPAVQHKPTLHAPGGGAAGAKNGQRANVCIPPESVRTLRENQLYFFALSPAQVLHRPRSYDAPTPELRHPSVTRLP